MLGWLWRGWSGGVMQSELLRALLRSAGGGVVGRLRVAPGTCAARPGLESGEVRARTGKSAERGPPAGSDLRPLIRRQGSSSAPHPSVRIPACSDSGSGEATSKRKRPAVGDGSAPLFCFGSPASGAQPARVAGFPCGSPAPSSSAAVPDTGFPTTCFARVFRFLLHLLRWWGPPSTLGPAQGPLEGTPGDLTQLGDIFGFP